MSLCRFHCSGTNLNWLYIFDKSAEKATRPTRKPRTTFSRSRVSIGPLHTRSFRHLPPDPSCLFLVPLLASNTGLTGVEAEPGLNWTLQGHQYWTSLFMNLFFTSSDMSSINMMYFLSMSFWNANSIASLVS